MAGWLMSSLQAQRNDTSEAAIFARVWEAAEGGLTPELARHVLKLRFAQQDQDRMHELARKNREERLTEAERDALDNYVKVGDLLAILQSKARVLLKRSPRRRP